MADGLADVENQDAGYISKKVVEHFPQNSLTWNANLVDQTHPHEVLKSVRMKITKWMCSSSQNSFTQCHSTTTNNLLCPSIQLVPNISLTQTTCNPWMNRELLDSTANSGIAPRFNMQSLAVLHTESPKKRWKGRDINYSYYASHQPTLSFKKLNRKMENISSFASELDEGLSFGKARRQTKRHIKISAVSLTRY